MTFNGTMNFDEEFELQDYSYYGLTLKNTCFACPESYNVYCGDTLCGYMRLRHGWFRTEYYKTPDDGEIVYECYPKGDGIFDDEREEHLKKGAEAIIKQMDVRPMTKKLKTLEEHNKIATQINETGGNGIACPNCRSELFDSDAILLSSPQQYLTFCRECNYKGSRW
jgi:hypothetical protein